MSAPIRVVRVIARLNVGGPARHVTTLDAGLRALGFDTLLAHGDIGAGEASLERLVEDTGIPALRIPSLGRRISILSDFRALGTLVRLVFRLQPHVVHTHTAKAGMLGRVAAALYNISRSRSRRCLVVHTFHGHVLHGYFGRLGSLSARLIERGLGVVTDCVLVLSPRQRADIGERYRIVPLSRIHIVPLGLRIETLTALPVRDETAEPARVTFGFVGRFVPIKHLPLLVEAFAIVHRSEPATRLMLAGDGELRSLLEASVAKYDLSAAVVFSGWRDDLTTLYRSMDVLVLTSLNEGTPVAVIEAMAAALPVIATDVGGVGDVVMHDRTGLLVPSGNVERLSAAMLHLARRPDDRRRLGVAARQAVRAKFSAERLATDMATLYRTELGRKRRTRPEIGGNVPGISTHHNG